MSEFSFHDVYLTCTLRKNTKLKVLTDHKRAIPPTKLRIRFAILRCIKSQINFTDEKAARKRSGRINDVMIAFDARYRSACHAFAALLIPIICGRSFHERKNHDDTIAFRSF